MAQKGTYAALQSLRGLGDGVSQDIKYWNEDGYARRAEEREVERIEQARKDKEIADKQANWDKYIKPLSNYDTKSTSLNEVQAFAIKQAENEMLKEVSVLNDRNATDEQKTRAKLRLGELGKTPDNLKMFTDRLTQEYQMYQELKQKGEAWYNADYEKRFADGYSSLKIGFDDSGKPIIAFADTNGDGKNDFVDVVDYSKIQTLQPTSDFMRRVNLDGIATALTDPKTGIGTTDVTTDNGFKSTRTKEAKKEELRTAVVNLMQDKDGKPTATGLSALREMGMDYKNPKPEDLQKAVDQVYKNALAKTDYLKESEIDRGSGSGSGAKTENTFDLLSKNKVRPTESVWGDKMKKINANNRFSVPVSKSVKIGSREELQSPEYNTLKDLDSGNSFSNASIESYTYDNKGNLYAKISYVKDKGGKDVYKEGSPNEPETKKTAIIRADADTKRDIANYLGISMEELWNLAVDKNDTESSGKKDEGQQGELD